MSGFYTERTLQQVPIPEQVSDAIKVFAADQSKTLNAVYDEMVNWFVNNKRKDQSLGYLTSPRASSKYRSLWLSSDVLITAKELAEKDEMSVNRVIYSSIVHFLKLKKYL